MRITNIARRKVFWWFLIYVWACLLFFVVTFASCSDFLVEGEVIYAIVKVPNGKILSSRKAKKVKKCHFITVFSLFPFVYCFPFASI